MGQILADPAALPKQFGNRGTDRGGCGVVHKVAVTPLRQFAHRVHQRPARRKTHPGVIRYRAGPDDIRRRIYELAGFQVLGGGIRTQKLTGILPGYPRKETRTWRQRHHLDLRAGSDFQPPMRLLECEKQRPISKIVGVLRLDRRLRVHRHCTGNPRMPGCRPWQQVGQIMADRNRLRIGVGSAMGDGIIRPQERERSTWHGRLARVPFRNNQPPGMTLKRTGRMPVPRRSTLHPMAAELAAGHRVAQVTLAERIRQQEQLLRHLFQQAMQARVFTVLVRHAELR